jgi:hypothetical protein
MVNETSHEIGRHHFYDASIYTCMYEDKHGIVSGIFAIAVKCCGIFCSVGGFEKNLPCSDY